MKYQKRQSKTVPGDYQTLSLTRAKLFLRETGTAQDDVIQDLINAADSYLEQSLDFIIDTSSLIYQYYDSFPSEDYVPIWHRFITTTDFVVEYWTGSAWAAFDSGSYRIDTASVPPRAILKDGYDWPEVTVSDLNAVRIGFKIDTNASFFSDLKAAVMTLVADRYENRQSEWNSSIMVSTIRRFVERYRLPGL